MPFGNKTQFLGDPFWRKRVRSGHTTLEKKGFLSPVVFRARERYVAVRTTYLGFDPFSYLRLAKKRVIFYPSKPGPWPMLWVGRVGIIHFKIIQFFPKKIFIHRYNTVSDDEELCIILQIKCIFFSNKLLSKVFTRPIRFLAF